jgi:pimeloyl-ACP methyl ester carboxylesterase
MMPAVEANIAGDRASVTLQTITHTETRMADALLHVRAIGNGKPILMLHGWGTSGEDLLPLAALLAETAQVHVVDLPGFGRSPRPPAPWNTADYARCLLDYISAHNLDPVDIVAHSFGGKVALHLASGHPAHVRRLVLMAASGIPPRRTVRKRVYLAFVRALRSVIQRATPWIGPSAMQWFGGKFGSRDYKAAGPMRPTFVRVVADDLTPQLGLIRSPTLLLWGSLDTETPLEMAERYKASIQSSRLVVLPNRDHFPYHDDGAQLCAYYINDFLRERSE